MSKRKWKKNIVLLSSAIITSAIAAGTYSLVKKDSNSDKTPDKLTIKKINKTNKILNIDFIDVGQGDSILISSDDYNVLIDTGNYKTERTVDNNLIYTPDYYKKLKWYLKNKLKNKKINLFVGTHNHSDHIGGLAQAINDFSIPNQSHVLMYGDTIITAETYKNVLDAIAKNNLNYIDPNLSVTLTNNFWANEMKSHYQTSEGRWNMEKLKDINAKQNLYTWADNIWLDFIAPSYDYHPGQPKKSPNEGSINLYLRYGDFDILFTGDSEGKTHEDTYNILKDKKYDIENNKIEFYKSAHHGSISQGSNNTKFLTSILDSESKIIISHNDNKKFRGTPTLTQNSLKFIKETKLFNSSAPIIDTQSLGDIELNLNNNGANFNFIHRTDNKYTNNKPMFWNDEVYGRLFIKK